MAKPRRTQGMAGKTGHGTSAHVSFFMAAVPVSAPVSLAHGVSRWDIIMIFVVLLLPFLPGAILLSRGLALARKRQGKLAVQWLVAGLVLVALGFLWVFYRLLK